MKAEISTPPYYTLPTDGTYEIEVRVKHHIFLGISSVTKQGQGMAKLEIEPCFPIR